MPLRSSRTRASPEFPGTTLTAGTGSDIEVLARRFGDVLRVGDGAAASRLVGEALAAGMTPESVQSFVTTSYHRPRPARWVCSATSR